MKLCHTLTIILFLVTYYPHISSADSLVNSVSALSHEDYEIRQRATQNLIKAGSKAIPFLLRSDRDNPEVAIRVERILVALATDGNSTNRQDAEEALKRIAPKALHQLRGKRWLITSGASLKRLELGGVELDLTDNKELNGEAISYLDIVQGLERLILHGASISDKELHTMPSLPSLRWLDLSRTSVTDNIAKDLNRFRELVVIDLSNTVITDVGLKQLELSKLRCLFLHGTRITDDSIDALIAIKKLAILNISSTRLTKQGVQRLKVGLPHCAILTDGK